MTTKGQVTTTPKEERDRGERHPDDTVRLTQPPAGKVVPDSQLPDRFEAMRGKAQIKWRTDELMALLRGND